MTAYSNAFCNEIDVILLILNEVCNEQEKLWISIHFPITCIHIITTIIVI